MREWFEYAAVWLVLKFTGILPRRAARSFGAFAVRMLLALRPRLKHTALFNLRLAFPDWSDAQREETIRHMTRYLGWMAAEFAHFPHLLRGNISDLVLLEGQEHLASAHARGKGVIFLTGHIGAWELSSFAHALYGFPLHFMVRPLDNPRVDALVNNYRSLSGNQPVYKNESARAALRILNDGGTIGILADHNTMPDEGVFVDFFGTPACTTAGIARLALHTGAAVVPGYAIWDSAMQKYRLCFQPAVELARSGDRDAEIRENTQRFTKIVEGIVRRYPSQWVWVHARWKTRPPGEPPLAGY
jgi:KDO2-lipid IV(A) lauroyltransferase